MAKNFAMKELIATEIWRLAAEAGAYIFVISNPNNSRQQPIRLHMLSSVSVAAPAMLSVYVFISGNVVFDNLALGKVTIIHSVTSRRISAALNFYVTRL